MARRWTVMLYARPVAFLAFRADGTHIRHRFIWPATTSHTEKRRKRWTSCAEYYLNTPEHRNVRGEMEMIKSLDLLHSPEIERITRLMALEGAIHFQSWRCWRVSDFADWNNTQLNPAISYLHEPSEVLSFLRYCGSLQAISRWSCDMLVNMLCDNDFVSDLNACLLNEKGRSLLRNGRKKCEQQ